MPIDPAENCINTTPWHRIPPEWSVLLTSEANSDPTGVWADYNYRYKLWRSMIRQWERDELIWCEDIPVEPDVDDYSDTESGPTHPG